MSRRFQYDPKDEIKNKWSQMPCNLVNFILVNQESEVRQGQQWREDMRKNEEKKGKQGQEKERKKGVKSSNPNRRGK